MTVQIQPLAAALAADEAAPWLKLNNEHAEQLSYLAPERMRKLVGEAFLAVRIGAGEALLIAFDQDADYDSVNFVWFKGRFERFVYVDRVVVDPGARGRGLARELYLELFARAQAAGHSKVVCEINSDPPNPGSEAFHQRLGFEEIGSAVIAQGKKTVRYYLKPLS